jgi:hypothetical protein
MARRPIVSVSNDFDDVLAWLRQHGIISAHATLEQVNIARAIHGYTYSLILWRFRLRNLPNHGKVFVEEIASDALQVLPQIMMGYSKTAKLLIRGISENALRHIYFSDHPIEFDRLNRDRKWYLTIEYLCDYARQHPIFLRTEQRFDAVNQTNSLYSELSAGVHGRTVRDLEMRVALQKVVYEHAAAAAAAALLRRCTEATNFLLAMFHRGRMRVFQAEDRRIILRTMPPRARQLWTEHE